LIIQIIPDYEDSLESEKRYPELRLEDPTIPRFKNLTPRLEESRDPEFEKFGDLEAYGSEETS